MYSYRKDKLDILIQIEYSCTVELINMILAMQYRMQFIVFIMELTKIDINNIIELKLIELKLK